MILPSENGFLLDFVDAKSVDGLFLRQPSQKDALENVIWEKFYFELSWRSKFCVSRKGLFSFVMNPNIGKYLVLIGLAIVVVGGLIYCFHDKLHWLGRLPGDIRVEKENFSFYFPITTMILFSVLLSLILRFVQKFF